MPPANARPAVSRCHPHPARKWGWPDGHRKTRFRLLARLYRAGLVTRKAPSKGFGSSRYIRPPYPGLAWRNDTFDFPQTAAAPKECSLPDGKGQGTTSLRINVIFSMQSELALY
jgi:hypothetical protein